MQDQMKQILEELNVIEKIHWLFIYEINNIYDEKWIFWKQAFLGERSMSIIKYPIEDKKDFRESLNQLMANHENYFKNADWVKTNHYRIRNETTDDFTRIQRRWLLSQPKIRETPAYQEQQLNLAKKNLIKEIFVSEIDSNNKE